MAHYTVLALAATGCAQSAGDADDVAERASAATGCGPDGTMLVSAFVNSYSTVVCGYTRGYFLSPPDAARQVVAELDDPSWLDAKPGCDVVLEASVWRGKRISETEVSFAPADQTYLGRTTARGSGAPGACVAPTLSWQLAPGEYRVKARARFAGTEAPPVRISAAEDAPPPPRGLHRTDVTIGGLARTYLTYFPATLSPTTAVPLLYVAHGYGMSAQGMADMTGIVELADREQIAVAFLDAANPYVGSGPWNAASQGDQVCGGAGASSIGRADDLSYLKAIRAAVEAAQAIDPAHVFFTGFSMGGYFTNNVACRHADELGISGFSAVAGATFADFSVCTEGKHPMLILQGGRDEFIPDDCAIAARDQWVAKNGCSSAVSATREIKGGVCHTMAACPTGGQVEYCYFADMTHHWSGAKGDFGWGETAHESATELTWKFFRSFAW